MVVLAEACLRRLPTHFATVPGWSYRVPRTQANELDHVAGRIGKVGQRRVRDIEIDQKARARLDVIGNERVRIVALSEVRLQVRPRNDPGRAALDRGVLREVEDHCDPGHVIARPGHRNVSVLVPGAVPRRAFSHGRAMLATGKHQFPLGLVEWFADVAGSVRTQDVAVAEDAGQGPLDDRGVQYLLQLGNPGQHVVPHVELVLGVPLELVEDLTMDLGFEAAVEHQHAIADVAPNLLVVQPAGEPVAFRSHSRAPVANQNTYLPFASMWSQRCVWR